MVDSNYPLAKHFDDVSEKVKIHGKSMSQDDLKICYGLFKQAKFGDNNTDQPSFYQLTEKGKWNAWNDQKGKSTDQAKHEYVVHCINFFPDDVKSTYSS